MLNCFKLSFIYIIPSIFQSKTDINYLCCPDHLIGTHLILDFHVKKEGRGRFEINKEALFICMFSMLILFQKLIHELY